jgi:methanogenic corrinoid protein MtbC1
MMLEESGRHFDPVLLEAFMEVLGSSGADARTQARSDKGSLLAATLEVYTQAIQSGDAESAEGAVASAIEDGIDPASLRDEVVAPAMSQVEQLCAQGDTDAEVEQLASAINRRVLATLNRYMLARGE